MGSVVLTKIRDVEIESFEHLIHRYWGDTKTLTDVSGNAVQIPKRELYPFIRELLSAYKCNIMSSIYGTGNYSNFTIYLNIKVDSRGFVALCRDILGHPADYYNTDEGEIYQDFCESLWVQGSGYQEDTKFMDYLKKYERG